MKMILRIILAGIMLVTVACSEVGKQKNKEALSTDTVQQTLTTTKKDAPCEFLKGLTLTKQELSACKAAQISETNGRYLKGLSKKSIQLIPKVNEFGELLNVKDTAGVCLPLSPKNNLFDVLAETKECFRKNGLLVFVLSDDATNEWLAAMKGNDELEIIKWRNTNGINYGLENKDVISKLKEWKGKYGLTVLQAGMDFLSLRFNTMPRDMDAFSKEVFQFCPDIVTQGTGDLPTLKSELIKMHGVYLWWD